MKCAVCNTENEQHDVRFHTLAEGLAKLKDITGKHLSYLRDRVDALAGTTCRRDDVDQMRTPPDVQPGAPVCPPEHFNCSHTRSGDADCVARRAQPAAPAGFKIVGRSGPYNHIQPPGKWIRFTRRVDGEPLDEPRKNDQQQPLWPEWDAGCYDILEPLPVEPSINAERARVNGWWRWWNDGHGNSKKRDAGIASGMPAPLNYRP